MGYGKEERGSRVREEEGRGNLTNLSFTNLRALSSMVMLFTPLLITLYLLLSGIARIADWSLESNSVRAVIAKVFCTFFV